MTSTASCSRCASNRAGTYDIWRMRASGAEPQRITHGGGVRPIQSPDGRYLYYALDRFETAVWRTPADGGREEMVLPSLSNWANFAVSGERIIFIPGVNAALLSTIQSFNPATGEKEVLMHLKRRPVWGLTAQAGTVLFSPQPPPKYTIGWQSLDAGTDAPCTSDITVQPAAP